MKLWLRQHAERRLVNGCDVMAVVRNGYLPQRTIQTGIADVEIKA
ncbi:MAG: hypothetical protein ACTS73_05455 [Arsenophonus sp. NEOnobi-MAG3]